MAYVLVACWRKFIGVGLFVAAGLAEQRIVVEQVVGIDEGDFIALGGVATIGSAVYLGINGTKLLNNQLQINDNLILKINPSGLALAF